MGSYWDYDDMNINSTSSGDWRDTALICENGHVINSTMNENPEFNKKYCPECGVKTISECPKCNKKIQGEMHYEDVIGGFGYTLPKYCHECGEPYPWTKSKLSVLNEMIELFDGLTTEEKEEMKESSKDISSDNPRTELGVLKIKKLTKQAGKGAWSLLENIIVQVASETAIKAMKAQGML